jgi:hypothetical protein
MRHRVWAASLFTVLILQAHAQAPVSPIGEQRAKEIALKAAGCGAASDCEVRGGPKDGKWVFVVWFVHSRDDKGAPRFMPGGWMGITIGPNGEVLDRMPGA